MNRLELLAPAGNWECFLAAIENGADAVYMGLSVHNARVMTNNFTVEEYKRAILYSHVKNVKVYLTLNTLLLDSEIIDVMKLLAELVEVGLDAVIVQDLGLANVIHKIFPRLDLHASTQMTVHNLNQVKALENLGFKRVVLARELDISEIKYICTNTKLDIEVFVHGALCVCYSGQCLLSSMIGERSGNGGNCAQPCRMQYALANSKNDIVANGYLLSKKDIYGLSHLKDLVNAGVKSFKIEGRNRSPEYVATVISIYRKYIDLQNDNINTSDEKDLAQIFNRDGQHSQYLKGKSGKGSISFNTPKNTGLKLGKILDIKGDFIKIKLEESINMHDGIEIAKNDIENVSAIVTCIKNGIGAVVNCKIEEGNFVWIGDIKGKVKIGDIVCKTSSNELNSKLKDTWQGKQHFRKTALSCKVDIKLNEQICMKIWNEKYELIIKNENVVISAISIPTTAESVIKQLEKTKDTPFYFSDIQCNIDNNCYVQISELNKLRREGLELFEKQYAINLDISKELEEISALNILNSKGSLSIQEQKLSIYLYNYNLEEDYSKYGAARIYIEAKDVLKYGAEIVNKLSKIAEIYISLPCIIKAKLETVILNKLDEWASLDIKGFLIGNIGYFEKLKKYGDKKIIADYTLNIFNRFSIEAVKNLGAVEVTLSPELSNDDINSISSNCKKEIIKSGYLPAITSEYCAPGSFVGGAECDNKCSGVCRKDKYHLIDRKGETLAILCDDINCTMRIFKKMKNRHDVNRININNVRVGIF